MADESTDSQPAVESPPAQDRAELISRARIFLNSPRIKSQDLFAKRKFLLEKGLAEPEIELLLRELPPQLPTVPPRAYPQPPPSSLPTLLLGLARLFSWVAGGSAILLAIYYRYLLPRIVRTAEARQSLKSHQISLLRQLNSSLKSLKDTQIECYSLLPRPNPHKEPSAFADCHTLQDVLEEGERQKVEINELPPLSLLRCAWEDLHRRPGDSTNNPTTEEIFQVLESRIPWLVTEHGIVFEHKLWETLSTSPLFESSVSEESEGNASPVYWSYTAPLPQGPSPVVSSLDDLATTLSGGRRAQNSPAQYTLQALTDFTGYISSHLYTPYRPPPIPGIPSSNEGPEDELRKEIRGLKGLVLSRRSFMSSISSRSNVPIGASSSQ